MDFKNIKKFIDMAKEEGVTELKYESKDCKISVSFGAVGNPIYTNQPISVPQMDMSAVTQNTTTVQQGTKSSAGIHEITSPFVGTFYGSASPGTPPFIKVGDRVSKGQTLCILEAMKIMNEIESDVAGEIVEICIDNESLVEFGQCLFKVRV